MERNGNVTSSYYRKVLAANYPTEHLEALAAHERRVAGKIRVKPSNDTRHSRALQFEQTFHVNLNRKPADPEPQAEPEEWSLTS